MSEMLATAAHVTPIEIARKIWSIPNHGGEVYPHVMGRFHEILKPKTYFEIGVDTGGTFRLARCPSIAVDPDFKIVDAVLKNKPVSMFYQMTSDDYFRDHSPSASLGGPIDLAFLDGMHWFEYLLRDFINTEKHCRNNSVVILHDCIPTDEHVGRRVVNDKSLANQSENKGWWAGDVWKAAAILLKYRKDLLIMALDAPPTGLICITNLNASSDVLEKQYFDLVAEYRTMTLARSGAEYIERLKVASTKSVASADMLSALFWL